MSKNIANNTALKHKRDETATIVAGIFGLTPRHVRRIMNGECENEDVLDATIIYLEGKNQLIKEVEKLVPFERKKCHMP